MDSARFVAVRNAIGRGWRFLLGTPGWKLDAFGVALALLLVQLLLTALGGVHAAGLGVLERDAVHVALVDNATDQRTQELYAALRGSSAVRAVTYVTKEQIFADELARDESLGAFLERYGMENPFSDSFVVVPAHADAYDAIRSFLQSDVARELVDAATFADLAERQASAVELLEAVDTARIGAALLLVLAIIVAAILSFNVLVRLLAARAGIAETEHLAGIPAGVLAVPAVTAGVIALLCALAASLLLAALVVLVLALLPSSAAIGAWMADAFSVGLAPFAPAVIGLEIALLVVLAWMVARAGSAFRA